MTMLPGFDMEQPRSKVGARLQKLADKLAPLTESQELLVEIGYQLAESIARGTAKGRSVAGDTERLLDVIERLDPKETTTEGSLNSDDLKILDALGGRAVLDPAPTRDSA